MGCSSSYQLTQVDPPPSNTTTYYHHNSNYLNRPLASGLCIPFYLNEPSNEKRQRIYYNFSPWIWDPNFKIKFAKDHLKSHYKAESVSLHPLVLSLADSNNNSNREKFFLVGQGRRWSEPAYAFSQQSNHNCYRGMLDMDEDRKNTSMDNSKADLISVGRMNICKPEVNALLVFGKEDTQCQTVQNAVGRMEYNFELALTAEKAYELYLQKQHHVVIIDRRQTKSIDGDALCRLIRSTNNNEFTTIVGIVRRRNQIDDYPSTKELLSAGFNRIICENTRVEEIYDELLQLDSGDILDRYKLRTYQVVFLALERSSDAIQITDKDHIIEYVNHAYELLTGFSSEQVIGHELSEFIQNETNEEDVWDSIREHIRKGKEWEGDFYTKRHSDEDIQQHVTICPISGHNGTIKQYVLVSKAIMQPSGPDLSRRKNSLEFRRNSVPAEQLQRRLSASSSLEGTDSASHRRTSSLAKIHSMTIEAPITQIINLISIVRENSHHQVSETLDQILDILRNSELYSPADLPSKSRDHMVSDFVEGLVTGAGYSHRRSSGSDAMLGKMSNSASLIKQSSLQVQHCATLHRIDIPPEIARCFENEFSWEYDILELERITQKKPLLYLGVRIMQEFGACEVLQCSEDVIRAWLAGIETKYHSENTYHNSTHAADVLHATAYFLRKDRVKEWMEPADEIAALIAAIIHDVDHPGFTNAFLVNSRNPLALLYNDSAVLESHHAAYAFRFTVSDDNHNIFKNLSRDEFMTMRQSIIDMVLATELSKHFEHVNKFISIVTKSSNGSPTHDTSTGNADNGDYESSGNARSSGGLQGQQNSLLHHEMRVLIKRVMIKMADVNNPARPRALCVEWARRISEEYFNQTDKEKELGLPVVMPHFDRAICQFPKSQITFIDYFLTDMFDAWHEFCNISEMMEQLNENYSYWKTLLDSGLMSLDELKDIEATKLKNKPDHLISTVEEHKESEEYEHNLKTSANCENADTQSFQSLANENNNSNSKVTFNSKVSKSEMDGLPSKNEKMNISIKVELPERVSLLGEGEAHQVIRGDEKLGSDDVSSKKVHLDVINPDRVSLSMVQPTSKMLPHSGSHKHLTFKDT